MDDSNYGSNFGFHIRTWYNISLYLKTMESNSRFLPTVLLAAALNEGCTGDDFNNAQVTAVDCYSMLPKEVEGDGEFLATPSYADSVETDSGVLKQFQIAFRYDLNKVDGLQNDALKDWVGIAYDSSEADPTHPNREWDSGAVFNVAFSDTIPEAYAEYELESRFDEISSRTIFAYADTEVTPSSYDSLKMVITNECNYLVMSANGDVAFPLTDD